MQVDKFSLWEWKPAELIGVGGVLVMIVGLSWYQIKLGEVKTRDSQRMADVEMVGRGISKYMDDYNVYPMMATAEGKLKSCGDKGKETCEWGKSAFVDEENAAYISKLPRDPRGDSGYTYVYWVSDDRKHFKLYMALENKTSKDYKANLTTKCGINVQCSWYVGK